MRETVLHNVAHQKAMAPTIQCGRCVCVCETTCILPEGTLAIFSRIEDPRYRAGFEEAVEDFIVKIQKRAVDKRKEMDANEPVELSREERLGPGGLDPVEVFETLPESMQEAFEQKDTQMLQVALEAMEPDEAKRHMDACEASGLWVQNNSSEEATVVDDGLA